MNPLEKRNPPTGLERMQTEFDQLLGHFGCDHREFRLWSTESSRPAVGSSVDGGKFVVRIDLPGIDFKNISLHVASGMLKVKASLFRNEIRYGSFEQSINLPEGITAENLNAVHRDGVLELSAPMPKESAPGTVKIQVEENKPDGTKKGA